MSACEHPLVLGFDTSGPYCAVALIRGEEVLAARAEDMARGQAERLMPLIEEILSASAVAWKDLSAVGVGVGPGNFTGIRIAVAAARGLALGLGVPAIGVNGFEARQHNAPSKALVAIPAPREQVYLAPDGAEPGLFDLSEARAIADGKNLGLVTDTAPLDIALGVARVAVERLNNPGPSPAPLYLRPADAAPSRDVPPTILP